MAEASVKCQFLHSKIESIENQKPEINLMAALKTAFFDDHIESHLKESFYVNDTTCKKIIKFVKRESSLEQNSKF